MVLGVRGMVRCGSLRTRMRLPADCSAVVGGLSCSHAGERNGEKFQSFGMSWHIRQMRLSWQTLFDGRRWDIELDLRWSGGL